VRKQVDILVVIGPAPLFAAHEATREIPIVMVASSADPVSDKVAISFARPGGNVTGLTYAEPDRFKKQLEILKTVVPRAQRVGVPVGLRPRLLSPRLGNARSARRRASWG
jgi:putative ABC transport system substrate-binding protein